MIMNWIIDMERHMCTGYPSEWKEVIGLQFFPFPLFLDDSLKETQTPILRDMWHGTLVEYASDFISGPSNYFLNFFCVELYFLPYHSEGIIVSHNYIQLLVACALQGQRYRSIFNLQLPSKSNGALQRTGDTYSRQDQDIYPHPPPPHMSHFVIIF